MISPVVDSGATGTVEFDEDCFGDMKGSRAFFSKVEICISILLVSTPRNSIEIVFWPFALP